MAGAKYRTGREARTEFNEEHAGRLFMREVPWPPAGVDPAYLEAYGKLDIRQVKRWSEIIYPESTGEAEPSVQAKHHARAAFRRSGQPRADHQAGRHDRDAVRGPGYRPISSGAVVVLRAA